MQLFSFENIQIMLYFKFLHWNQKKKKKNRFENKRQLWWLHSNKWLPKTWPKGKNVDNIKPKKMNWTFLSLPIIFIVFQHKPHACCHSFILATQMAFGHCCLVGGSTHKFKQQCAFHFLLYEYLVSHRNVLGSWFCMYFV
jgi:hypothetical protein